MTCCQGRVAKVGAAPAGRLSTRMGILDRILRAGEGKKLKALEGLVPDINAHSAAMSALTDRPDHLGDAVRAARMAVCEALVYRGRLGALEAIGDPD